MAGEAHPDHPEILAHWLTVENINVLMDYYHVPREIDFFATQNTVLQPFIQFKESIMPSLESILGGDVQSIALLKVLADNSFDSVLVTDATPQGKIIYANKAASDQDQIVVITGEALKEPQEFCVIFLL